MQYDPIKSIIGKFVNRSSYLRKVFYGFLDILLLRSWHVIKAVRIFAKQNPSASAILDAGSGFGQYTYRMWRMNKNWNIKSIDIKQEQIEDCTRFFKDINASSRVNFELGDLTEYAKPRYYDLILSVDVMEHIEDDNSVFKNFYNSLKDGGTLLISTPSDKGGSDVHHHQQESFIDEHVRDGYSRDDIRSKLQGAGFKNIEAVYTYGYPGKISWVMLMKYPVLMLNKSWLFAIVLPFWYLIIILPSLFLNYLDTAISHNQGTGLMVVAKKD